MTDEQMNEMTLEICDQIVAIFFRYFEATGIDNKTKSFIFLSVIQTVLMHFFVHIIPKNDAPTLKNQIKVVMKTIRKQLLTHLEKAIEHNRVGKN
jgi:hypothetical protein